MNAIRFISIFLIVALAGYSSTSRVPQAQRPGFVRPEVITRVDPEYPPKLKERGVEGFALVQFDITKSGVATNFWVVETNDVRFGRAAVDAIRKWKFKPGTQDGVPVVTKAARQRLLFNWVEKKEEPNQSLQTTPIPPDES